MVITFDFDDTLLQSRAVFDEDGDFDHKEYLHDPNPEVWPELEAALERGDTVYIVTSRTPGSRNYDSPWETVTGKPATQKQDLEGWLRKWKIASQIAGVFFTSGALKRDKLEELGSQRHYDDDTEELANLPPGCEGVQAYPHPSWMRSVNESHLRSLIRSLL
jgi:hypothetical protein